MERRQIEALIRRMGIASAVILDVLDSPEPSAVVDIHARIADILHAVGAVEPRFGLSTVHKGLWGLVYNGLVESRGVAKVAVPSPYGTTRLLEREVFALTADGEQALAFKDRLDRAMHDRRQARTEGR
jgi:hypothetical protein